MASLDPRWHLEQGVYQITKGDIEFTFVDTSPVIQSYHQEKWASLPGKGLLQGDGRGEWGAREDGVAGRMGWQGA